MTFLQSVLFVVASFSLPGIWSLPNGAPLQACRDLTPRHPLPPQNSIAPYNLIVKPLIKDEKNVGLEITMGESSDNDPFRRFQTLAGFLIAVRDDSNGRFVGKLTNIPGTSKWACNSRAAVTHIDNGQKAISGLQFLWEPQTGELQAPISVRVYGTFVKTVAQYWTPLASMPILISPA